MSSYHEEMSDADRIAGFRARVRQLEEYIQEKGLPLPAATVPVDYSEKRFKLSSQVLTVTRAGMVHKSLAEILAESAGRDDQREPDTPTQGKSLGFSPSKKKKKKDSDSAMLDRIATVKSLAALRTDKMLYKPFPPLARTAMDYIASAYNDIKNTFHHDIEKFYRNLKDLCRELLPILARGNMYEKQRTPAYTFGDVHGNYGDVSYFLENIINFVDLEYTPCNIIFLGDYVDRGPYGLEVLCLLLSLKLSNPSKVTLLRGNHEDPLVNGDVRHYGDSAFQRQCLKTFGGNKGMDIWKSINELFAHFPLCADIDGKIFCCHGGIPRYNGGHDDRLELLRSPNFPHLEMFSTFEPAVDEQTRLVQIASDLCWSDPKDVEDDATGYWELNEHGFGNNTRGEGVLCFGEKAVDEFCDIHGFEFIFRAHQEKSDGLKLAKSGRVITIFSSSDYEGHQNGAGVLFVNSKGEIRMIMKHA
eukprot:TRINITY_DN2298_c0_g4_i1.p1 TRINITY_DN2298_c0_g4~~TRINITY_DN2298_c0_g4_i1.p1  ORF type:complete len:473 (+),score=200.29 TRINITY_DN2298_c0_g4_i1:95-1513(+)